MGFSNYWTFLESIRKPLSSARLQSMAVFDEISSAEKAQILGEAVQNICQVQMMSELRGKSNKICVKNNEN